jgi:hypothetical protein
MGQVASPVAYETDRVIPLDEWSEAELSEFAGIVGGERTMARERFMRRAEPAWESEPPFRLEDLDLLSLTSDEVFPFAQMLQKELRRLREVLHVSVEQLAAAHRKLNQRHKNDGRSLGQEAPASPPNQIGSRAANVSNDSRR